MSATYSVCVWDHDLRDGRGGWEQRYAGLTRWGIRAALRELAGEGWVEDHTLLVEREDAEDGGRDGTR